MSHEEFAGQSYILTEKFLRQTGIYEIVSPEEVSAALKGKRIDGWLWEKDDWKLAKKVGMDVWADYVMIVERNQGAPGSGPILSLTLINLENGKKFSCSGYAFRKDQQKEFVRESYGALFKEAKGDLLMTALKKGRRIVIPEPVKAPKPVKAPEPVKAQEPPEVIAQKPVAQSPNQPAEADKGKTRIIVYDFDSLKGLDVAALILAESLREEMLKFGRFVLVNREDMSQALKEFQLQQSGLTDEKQAADLGKWLTAEEAITGKLSALGQTIVLQTKRINIKTMGTLAAASVKCRAGNEEMLLSNIPELAGKLTANLAN